jgi:hypothetical protein
MNNDNHAMAVQRLVDKLKSALEGLEELYTRFGALKRDSAAPSARDVEDLIRVAKPQIDKFRQFQKIGDLMVKSQEPKAKRKRPRSQYIVLSMVWGCLPSLARTQSFSCVFSRVLCL